MKLNRTAQVLLTTLALCGTVVSPAMAQYGYGQPNQNVYPNGSYGQPGTVVYPNGTTVVQPGGTQVYPQVYPNGSYGQQNPYSTTPTVPVYPTRVQTSTSFICGRVGIYPATLVQANGRILQSPLIVFQTASDNLTPEQRCNDVSQRMTRAVAQNGGKLSNLLLTTGKVNGQAVVCFVNTAETCNPSNVVLTLLRQENAKNPGKVLARLVRFGNNAGGSNVLESGGLAGDGSVDIEPAAVSLEEAVNELASESGSLESGGTVPDYNQAPVNNAPSPGNGGDGRI